METGTGDPRRIWKRVAPTLEPWPGADALGKALRDGAKVNGVILSADADAKSDKSAAGAQTLSVTRTARNLDAVADASRSLGAVTGTSRSLGGVADTSRSLGPIADTPRSLGPVITSGDALSASDAANLPGAEPDPCCMGTEAENDTAVLSGFAEDEYAERRQLQALARQSPVWARQTLLTLAAHAAARAKKSIAAYYLITGETYLPALCTERIYVGKFLPALRERYHSAACAAMNYERAADGTPDPCLNALFRDLSADAFECAAAVMRVLERALT